MFVVLLTVALVFPGAHQPTQHQPLLAQAQPAQHQPAQAQPGETTYIWPTNGVIIDLFRVPKTRYGRGNRGLEFATPEGSSFWAAADGVVSFAGQVGGRLHVTVAHPDGLRTSYSGVQTIATDRIKKGARVRAGEILGTTHATLHVGVRRGDTYLDPELIFPPRSNNDPADNAGNDPRNPRTSRHYPRLIPTGKLPMRLTLFL